MIASSRGKLRILKLNCLLIIVATNRYDLNYPWICINRDYSIANIYFFFIFIVISREIT